MYIFTTIVCPMFTERWTGWCSTLRTWRKLVPGQTRADVLQRRATWPCRQQIQRPTQEWNVAAIFPSSELALPELTHVTAGQRQRNGLNCPLGQPETENIVFNIALTNWKSAIHWNGNVIILTKFSSLAALEVVILTTSSAANDENFIQIDDILVSLFYLEC